MATIITDKRGLQWEFGELDVPHDAVIDEITLDPQNRLSVVWSIPEVKQLTGASQ